MNQLSYKIVITGPSTRLEHDINELQFKKIVATVIMGEVDHTVNSVNPEETRTFIPENTVSIREFLDSKEPKTNPQKIAAFLMYLRDVGKQDNASANDIKIQFEKSKEAMPKKLGRDIDTTIRYGWIAESTIKDRYYLTSTGEKVVSSKFDGITGRASYTRRGITGGKKAKGVIRQEFESLELNPTTSEGVNYWSLKTKGEKILFLLMQVKENGFSDINYKELSYLATKIGDNISENSIAGNIESQKKAGRLVNPPIEGSRRLRILEPGIKYLKGELSGEG